MDQETLNQRCVRLMQHPRVKLQMWYPGMFWDIDDSQDPSPSQLTRPKVDLRELEVMLSAAAYEPSVCAQELNAEQPGRADFIIRAVHHGERPLLSRP